jgi:uncharacterized protein (UPF0335 family)
MLITSDTKLHLTNLIERVERLEEEKSKIAEHISEVYGEAKSSGFDVKTMKQIVKMRKLDSQEMQEQEELLDIYRMALGMIPDKD